MARLVEYEFGVAGRRSRPDLWQAMGHRNLFQSRQKSPRDSSRISRPLVRRLNRACHLGLYSHQWLALEVRKEEDVRTVGELFYVQCQELEDITLGAVMDQILAAFAATLAEDLDISETQIEQVF